MKIKFCWSILSGLDPSFGVGNTGQLHSYSLQEQSSGLKTLTICSGCWERCLHMGGREGQAALNPMLNKLASFLN